MRETAFADYMKLPLVQRAFRGDAKADKHFDYRILHDARLRLPNSPFFGFLAIFENAIARCSVVGVRDDHSPVVVLGLLLIFVASGHDGAQYRLFCIASNIRQASI